MPEEERKALREALLASEQTYAMVSGQEAGGLSRAYSGVCSRAFSSRIGLAGLMGMMTAFGLTR